MDSPHVSLSEITGTETLQAHIIDGLTVLSTNAIENPDVNFTVDYFLNDEPTSDTLFVSVSYISDEIIEYVEGYSSHIESINDPFAIPSNPFSNIEGGTGIFGSISTVTDTLIFDLPK